jgi:type IV pilus assembly protein PilQ
MKRLGQELGWIAVAAAVFLAPGLTGCTATLEGGSPAPQDDERAAVESRASEDVTVGEAVVSAEPDPALVASAAGAAEETPLAAAEPAPPMIDDSPLEATLRVHEIGLEARDGHQAVVLFLSRAPDDVRHFVLDAPNRLVLDVIGPVPGTGKVQAHEIGSADVARLRIGEHPGKLRVVADLSGPLPDSYTVADEGRTLILGLPATDDVPTNETVFLAPGVLPSSLRTPTHVTAAATEATELPIPSEPAPLAETDEPTLEAMPADPSGDAPIEVAVTSDEPPALEPVPEVEAVVVAVAETEDLSPIDHVYEISADGAPVVAAAPEDVPAVEVVVVDEPTPWDDEPVAAAESAEPTYVMPVQDTAGVDGYSGQRISLDFKDADIQNVLRILADVSGLNIITTEDVGGRLTIRLMDVPWDQALDSILKAQGLDMVRDGNIVRISTVGRLKEERDALRAADEAQKQAEPLLVRYMRVNYAKADEDLVKKVREVLTERGTATWDERTNTIVVRDISRGVGSAEELITEFDTQTPQVLIEANIVEATESFARDLGVQWGYTYNASPETGNAPGQNFPGRVRGGGILAGGENSPASLVPFIADFPAASVAPGSGAAYDLLLGSLDGAHNLNARLTALERQGKGKVISRPRVVTLNNVAAKIESLEILRVKLPSTGTVISTGAGGAAGAAQNATEQIRTGIVLKVTPQVSSDGYIFLDVYAKSSALVSPEQSQAPSPDGIPNEVSREAESHVLIKDGETFVLGGVFRNILDESNQGLPFLSNIPVIGWAFKNQRDIDNRQELLVFVTPRAVRARGTENVASLPSAESLWHNRDNP